MREQALLNATKTPRVVVVSLRKAGTHLIREVLSAFGYSLVGTVSREARHAEVNDPEGIWTALSGAYQAQELQALTQSDDGQLIRDRIEGALAATYDAWRVRFGVLPDPNRLDELWPGKADPALVARVLEAENCRSFSSTPQNICWFEHSFERERIEPRFLREWELTGLPRLIFTYRDPRDVVLSMVNFLTEAPDSDLGDFPDHHTYARILKALPTLDERLTLALSDPDFPGANAFEDAAWLRHHPQVCAVSFEDLIGPRGGSSLTAQQATVLRIASFLDLDCEPAHLTDLAGSIFNDQAHTFRSGQRGRWRAAFSPAHRDLFTRRHSDVLATYGYS